MNKLTVTASSGKTVNLRQQPNTSSKVLQSVPIMTEVELLEKTSEQWYKIKYLETEGYMMTKYLKKIIEQDDLRKIYNSLRDTLILIEKILK